MKERHLPLPRSTPTSILPQDNLGEEVRRAAAVRGLVKEGSGAVRKCICEAAEIAAYNMISRDIGAVRRGLVKKEQ